MTEQTENYIILKPISERFNRIANNISDDEIKCLIKDEIRNQLRKIDFFSTPQEIIEDYIEDHEDDIISTFRQGLNQKLRNF